MSGLTLDEKRAITKQDLVDRVIESLKKDLEAGDESVLDELLFRLDNSALVCSLPEEEWGDFIYLS
jgi:hypothetical protein